MFLYNICLLLRFQTVSDLWLIFVGSVVWWCCFYLVGCFWLSQWQNSRLTFVWSHRGILCTPFGFCTQCSSPHVPVGYINFLLSLCMYNMYNIIIFFFPLHSIYLRMYVYIIKSRTILSVCMYRRSLCRIWTADISLVVYVNVSIIHFGFLFSPMLDKA